LKRPKLAYVRPLEYFSSSSYGQFHENPVEFYINRLGPEEFKSKREPQGLAQAMGIGFDEAVKAIIENRPLNWEGIEVENKDEVIKQCLALSMVYTSCGALNKVIADSGQILGCEVEVTGLAPGTDVPLRGFVDLVMHPTWLTRSALDWKVYGGGAPQTQRSPNKGYLRRYTEGQLLEGKKAVHDLCDEPMETLNEKWARQLAMYHWMLNPGRPIDRCPGAIDQITFSRGVVTITQYRTWISKEYQEKLRDGLVESWDIVQQERVVPSDLEPEFLRLLM